MTAPRLLLLTAILAPATPATGEVSGNVVDGTGAAVAHARVAGSAGDVAYTGPGGTFRLPETTPPATVEVSHPRFVAQERRVEDAGHFLVVLVPRPSLPPEDTAVVPARRPRVPATIEPATVAPAALGTEPRTLESALSGMPGAAPDGAGGLHQGLAVRGLAGRRLITVVAGVPIVPLRDDGAAASFVDPSLIERVDLLRGPAGVGHGSLGGVIEAHPLQLEDTRVEAGAELQGAERRAMGGWGLRGYATAALAVRASSGGEAGSGEDLDDGHLRGAALLRGHGPLGELDVDIVLLPAWTRDAGIPRSGAAGEDVEVSEEEHLLAHVAIGKDDWIVRLHAHPGEVVTETRQSGETTRVESNAFDAGASFELRRVLGDRAEAALGLDLAGRRGVDRVEERDTAAGRERVHGLEGAREDGAALFGTLRTAAGPLVLEGGGRLAWQRQDDAGAEPATDALPTAFVGVLWPAAGGLELAASLGTGLRFPALEERYGTTTTPDGEVRGNPDLSPERSTTLEASFRRFGDRLRVEGALFGSELRGFIQPGAGAGAARTLENVARGRIVGAELDAALGLSPSWRVAARGHWQRGRDDDGRPLADVAAGRLGVAVTALRGERMQATLEATRRFDKDDPGPGEEELDGFVDVSATGQIELGRGVRLGLHASNLLDREARQDADARAPSIPGRSVGASLRWRFF